MNSIFRFLVLGALVMTFTIISFAQDPCADIDAQQANYKKFTDSYNLTTLEGRRIALSAAKEYVEKYGSCPEGKQQTDYFNTYIPKAEQIIKDQQTSEEIQARHVRFDSAMKAKNYDEAYAAGKEIIEKEQPITDAKGQKTDIGFDVTMVLASIGLDESAKGNTKYNADTLRYDQMAIDSINSGRTSKTFGLSYPGANYTYVSKDYSDTKSNALGWMNYTIAYLKYYVDKSDAAKKDAIPYFYKVTQLNSIKKNRPEVYYAIGANYYAELTRLETDRQAKIDAAGKKDTDETKAIFAMEKGYADRVLDAYSRVYNLLSSDPKDKATKDSTYKDLKDVYTFRYQGKENALDALIAGAKSKPLPDPSTAVTPVIEVEPTPAATTTGTTTTPTVTTAPATTIKPATTTTITTKPAATTKPATATKPAPKKTNPKR